MDNYDLRSALADALPAAGPTRAAVKAMDDIGFKSDPKNNDMRELFVGLDVAGGEASKGASVEGAAVGGPSAAQVLLDYRREKKKSQEAAEEQAARLLKAGAGAGAAAAAVGGVGLARAAGVGGLEVDQAADDERHLRKVNLSKTAARMSSKQKRRRKQGKVHGSDYEDKYTGKVLNKTTRKGRMLAMKQMY